MAKMTNGNAASPELKDKVLIDRSCGVAPAASLFSTVMRGLFKLRQQLALLAFMLFLYGSLLWLIGGSRSSSGQIGLTFNSMLAHLLHGQFDVDPWIVGDEGFLRNGRVYAYWGIWCALLRIPLWIFNKMNIDMTMWSCLAAVCLAGMAKVRTVLLLQRHGANDRIAKSAIGLMLAYLVLGGSGIGYLKPSIFQEVVFWAAAFGAIFVYFAIKGLVNRQFGFGTLCWMASCAGLAVLTRVSTCIGLTLAFVLLELILVAQSGSTSADRQPRIQQWVQALLNRRTLIPLAILALFIAATGAVNYFRWGNPTTFTDLSVYIGNRLWPERVQRDAMYGMFNLSRIPFGVIYYFFPVLAYVTSSGYFLFETFQVRLFDDVEFPPSSFLLTDLLPFCFIAFFAVALTKRRIVALPSLRHAAALAAGLLAPCFLMLSAVSMTYRYRMEFYPEIDLLAFLGLYSILTNQEMRAKFARFGTWMELAMIVSVVVSFAALLLYGLSPFGPAQDIPQHRLFH